MASSGFFSEGSESCSVSFFKQSKWNTVFQGWPKRLIIGALMASEIWEGPGQQIDGVFWYTLSQKKKYIENICFNVANMSPRCIGSFLKLALETLKWMTKRNHFMAHLIKGCLVWRSVAHVYHHWNMPFAFVWERGLDETVAWEPTACRGKYSDCTR